MKLSRRNLLLSAGTGAFMASAAPGLRVAMAQQAGPTRDILIVLYLRGGSDGLHMIAPSGDPDYVSKRPTLAVPANGPNAGVGLGTLDGVDFYLNPNASELKPLYDAGHLAVIQAAGLEMDDRSHFVCMEKMERGVQNISDSEKRGWLTRHLDSLGGDRPVLGTVAASGDVPTSLLKHPQAVGIWDAENFNLWGSDSLSDAIRSVNMGNGAHNALANQTLNAVASVQQGIQDPATQTTEGVEYPDGDLSHSLQSLARLIKMDVGIDIATVDQHGWDHHDNLSVGFPILAQELSRSLAAFWTDVADYQSRITLVTMTEFGRRLEENGNRGTDHGAASYMFLLGGNVNGGKIYGDWPGLRESDLYFGDPVITTDYRTVLSEVLVKRHLNPQLHEVFPTIPYNPLGIVQGDDSIVASAATAALEPTTIKKKAPASAMINRM
jgi:uncharacterized protein (DUF1501 family)